MYGNVIFGIRRSAWFWWQALKKLKFCGSSCAHNMMLKIWSWSIYFIVNYHDVRIAACTQYEPALLIFFFKATITQKHQNIMFLKNCLSIKSPLGYNSSGEFLWETYKLSNKKYECFFGGNQFFQLLLLIAKNPAGKKGKKIGATFKKHFPILTPIMYQQR